MQCKVTILRENRQYSLISIIEKSKLIHRERGTLREKWQFFREESYSVAAAVGALGALAPSAVGCVAFSGLFFGEVEAGFSVFGALFSGVAGAAVGAPPCCDRKRR